VRVEFGGEEETWAKKGKRTHISSKKKAKNLWEEGEFKKGKWAG